MTEHSQKPRCGLKRALKNLLPWMFSQQPFKVVSFHTDDPHYAEHAARLKESAERLGVDIHMVTIPAGQAWELNCAFKAKFIRDQWVESDLPVVWVDADATFEASPELFYRLNCDFGIHRWDGWIFASGTLYFGKSDLAGRLLDAWVTRCQADPTLWDQIHLASAWADISAVAPLQTEWLPQEYLQIFDGPLAKGQIVIKHWQASRTPKAEGNTVRSTPLYSEAGERAMRELANWRSPEQAFWILEGADHIIPSGHGEFPEGFDLSEALQDSLMGTSPVLEFGCGVGRVAALFDRDVYFGIDINPAAIEVARTRLPEHRLYLHDMILELPAAPAAFAYTVFLHISDDELHAHLGELAKDREIVVIAELMDCRWRRDGNPPVFNRSPEDYVAAMAKHGFKEVRRDVRVYERYNTAEIRETASPDITFLTFRKAAVSLRSELA